MNRQSCCNFPSIAYGNLSEMKSFSLSTPQPESVEQHIKNCFSCATLGTHPGAPDQFIEVPHACKTFRQSRKSFCHGNWAGITFASQRKWILRQIKLEITFGKFSNWHCRSALLTEIIWGRHTRRWKSVEIWENSSKYLIRGRFWKLLRYSSEIPAFTCRRFLIDCLASCFRPPRGETWLFATTSQLHIDVFENSKFFRETWQNSEVIAQASAMRLEFSGKVRWLCTCSHASVARIRSGVLGSFQLSPC